MKTLSAFDLSPEQKEIEDFVREIFWLRLALKSRLEWLSVDLENALTAAWNDDRDEKNTVKNYFTVDFHRNRMRGEKMKNNKSEFNPAIFI